MEYEVELVRTIRTKVRVTAASAAEVRRKIADEDSGYAEDIWQSGSDECDGIRAVAVRAAT